MKADIYSYSRFLTNHGFDTSLKDVKPIESKMRTKTANKHHVNSKCRSSVCNKVVKAATLVATNTLRKAGSSSIFLGSDNYYWMEWRKTPREVKKNGKEMEWTAFSDARLELVQWATGLTASCSPRFLCYSFQMYIEEALVPLLLLLLLPIAQPPPLVLLEMCVVITTRTEKWMALGNRRRRLKGTQTEKLGKTWENLVLAQGAW